MKRKWISGRKPLWFVIGTNESIWLSTASFTKRGALKSWHDQQRRYGPHPWAYWYRRGFRCRLAHIRYAFAKGASK